LLQVFAAEGGHSRFSHFATPCESSRKLSASGPALLQIGERGAGTSSSVPLTHSCQQFERWPGVPFSRESREGFVYAIHNRYDIYMRLLLTLGISLVLIPGMIAAESGAEFFEKNVRPLFAAKCIACHGAAAPAGGLRLDGRDALMRGGGRGAAIVAGKPSESLLLNAVRHTAGPLKMPPGPKLTEPEVARLAQWVEMGAPWGATVSQEGSAARFWSFVPPAETPLPAVKNKEWAAGNPIDRFILAKLEEKGLTPARPASKRNLIRRASYDLTGLPPTPAEVRAFLDDNSPRAFERVIDRLLASPRYGERWGRHWLDVARYADSNGLDENLVYKNAFRYRDYVIQAFNKDKPYNAFLEEQIAGDLMPSPDEKTQFERWTATGFLSLGAKMLAEDDPLKMEMDIIDEQLDTVGRTFMGLTIGCARCHDHKFDPVPTADYYSLAGIFKSTKTMEHFNVVAKWHEHVLAPKADRDRLEAHEASIEAKRKEAGKISGRENRVLTDAAKARIGPYLLAAHEVMSTRGGKLSPLAGPAVEREATGFDAANITTIERKKNNVPKGVKGPYYTEYRLEVPGAGDYQIDLFDEERGAGTADLYLNGELVSRGLPAVQNREASPDDGGWAASGIFAFKAGVNVLRFQHRSRFPYFGKLRVGPSPLPAGTAPRTEAQIASRHGVSVSFLEQMVEHLERSNGAPASQLFLFENFGKPTSAWASPAAKLFAGFEAQSREAVAGRYQELFTEAARQWEALPKAEREKKDAALKDPGLESLRQLLVEKYGPFRAPSDARDHYPAAARAEIERVEEEVKSLEAATPQLPRAMGVREGKEIADLAINIRGSHWTLGEKVPRRFLRAIAGENQQPIDTARSGRLELARWLTEPGHPLTSRVMVNRLWRWHFGAGIVPSSDNFGRLGEKPVNQPLLDWLARRFIAENWSIKAMHRLIMLSNTYRMASDYDERSFETDPENSLLWRANRKRLEAEAIRDAIMAVSGDLNTVEGGSILSYKDREYVANTSRRGGVDYDRNIRAVYIPVVRSSMYEVFTAFDLPDPAVPKGDRESSVIAPQALFMMNSVVALRHSRKFADALLKLDGGDEARIQEAYERALSRPATGTEIDRALTFIANIEKALPGKVSEPVERRAQAWQSFAKALVASNEFIYLN